MNPKDRNRVCPVERAGGLDNCFRRIYQNPGRILKPYIQPGMTILDVGCGPGFFTIEMARILNGSGKVIAADLQQGMLEIVKTKIKESPFEKLVELHKCESGKMGVTTPVDFILAFYVLHELPDQKTFFEEVKSILKPGGGFLIAEPKSHVTVKEFEVLISDFNNNGFKIIKRPKILFSRSVMLKYECNVTVKPGV